MESNGRKKHTVNGQVAEIKKQEKVSEESVGQQKKGRLAGLFKGLGRRK